MIRNLVGQLKAGRAARIPGAAPTAPVHTRQQPLRTTTARGYGTPHQRERARWAPAVEAGKVNCWRCTHRIQPEQPWDLGHDDTNRNHYRGPEHVACNRATTGRQTSDPEPMSRTQW